MNELKLSVDLQYSGKSAVFKGRPCKNCGCQLKIMKRGCHDCYMRKLSESAKLQHINGTRRANALSAGAKTFESAYECKKCTEHDFKILHAMAGEQELKSWLRYTKNGACCGCDTFKKLVNKESETLNMFPSLTDQERIEAGLKL